MSNDKNPDRIWLEPFADQYGYDGRQWCTDNVWTDEENGPAVLYLRSDVETWQPATTKPPNAGHYLVITKFRGYPGIRILEYSAERWYDQSDKEYTTVYAWQRLPTIPDHFYPPSE